MGGTRTFGSYLRRMRLRHPGGLSIREVARRAGIDVSYVSRMEKDEVAPPREEVILKLAEVLGLDGPDELLRLANKIPPDVQDIIRKNYQEIPSFLRSASKLKPEDWSRLSDYLKKNILPKKDSGR
jgi:HTH-type transcriptional regulator, competence development regulator